VLYYLLLLIIGILGGGVAGMLGVGGGLIFTPVLIFIYAEQLTQPVPWIIATSLLCTFAASLSSVRTHWARDNMFWKEGLLVGVCSLLGTTAGIRFVGSGYYEQREFSLLFSALLLYTAYRFLLLKTKAEAPAANTDLSNQRHIYLPQALLIGALGGVIATLAGVGGGIVMVPIMSLLLSVPYQKTISISSTAIVCISFFSWVQFALKSPAEAGLTQLTLGFVDFGTGLPLLAGALIGANYGVLATGVLSKKTLQRIFGSIALLVAAELLINVFT
jgi:uncharacterized membrane protein YfcA